MKIVFNSEENVYSFLDENKIVFKSLTTEQMNEEVKKTTLLINEKTDELEQVHILINEKLDYINLIAEALQQQPQLALTYEH